MAISSIPRSQDVSFLALLNGPAGPAPGGITPYPGKRPGMDHHPANSILGLCLALSTLTVALRIYVKRALLCSVAWEDYTILLAWMIQIPTAVITFKALEYGSGAHMWDLRMKDFINMLYWIEVFVTKYLPIVCLIKEAILLQYIKIFIPNRMANMRLYIVTQALIWSILLFYLATLIFALARCQPREKAWNNFMESGHCANANVVERIIGIFNIVSDFALLLLPLVPKWKLQMTLKKRVMLMMVFGTGLGACITSIMRTYYTFKYLPSADLSFHLLLPGLWAWGEICMGTLVFCMPAMPKFWHHARTKIHGTFTHVKSSFFGAQDLSSSKEAVIDENLSLKPMKHWFDRHTKLPSRSTVREESPASQLHSNKSYTQLSEIQRVELGLAHLT